MLLLKRAFRFMPFQTRFLPFMMPGLRFLSTKETTSKDYYDILGLDPSATEEDIKVAYRKLAKMYHPDINATDSNHEPNAEKFRDVAEAYSVLSYHESRLRYNTVRKRLLEKSSTPSPIEVQEYFNYIY